MTLTLEELADITPEEEAVCRAICIADDCDPDAESVGLGHIMPADHRYKLWQARLRQARAAIAAIRKTTP